MEEERESTQRRPATERADELLSRAGQTAGIFASLVGMRVARVAAFAREEVEDMWAEARSIRQQTVEAEANGETTASASEGVDISEQTRGEAEKREPEERTEPDQAKAGTATAEATDNAIKPGDYVGAAGRKEEEQDAGSDGDEEEIKATDTARRRAEELGVDLQEVEGTGAHGQITVEDVKKKAES